MDLKAYLQKHRDLVNRTLAMYLPAVRGPAFRVVEAMHYSLMAGGKRLRPILCLAAAEAVGGDVSEALAVACALEMIHTYSLIHDDLPAMDDDDLRRGKPTNHVVFGEGMAILAGDGLLTEAFRVMSDGALQPGQNRMAALRAIREIAAGAGSAGMVGGQVADLESEKKRPTRTLVEYIHTRKTGALIRASVRAGAWVGGAKEAQFVRLDRYGTAIGLAFQVADDILDVEGDAEKTGKRAGRDAELQKVTYPAAVGLDNAKRKAKELLDESLAALAPFNSAADPLRQIATFIVERAVQP